MTVAIIFLLLCLRAVGGFVTSALGSKSSILYKQSDIVLSMSIQQKPEGRRYASYNIYKGRGAIAVKIIAPTWSNIGIPESNSMAVSKEGGLLFEFAPCVGTKEYDWSKKMTFFLDVTECGSLLYQVQDGLEFIHDPGALTAQAGQVTKRMKWSPTPDTKGIFVSLSIVDKNNPDKTASISLPVSYGEFMVIDSIIRFAIPRFLGIDQVFGKPGAMNYGVWNEQAPLPPPPQPWVKLE